jgi:hypothetical protein
VDSELVVDVQSKEITIAVLEERKLVELQQESQMVHLRLETSTWAKLRN